jgi:CysZ protein
MIRQSANGMRYVLKGINVLFKPGIRLFVILPLAVNVVLFGLFMWLGVEYFSDFMNEYIPRLPQALQWLEWLIWPLFLVSFLLIGFYCSLLIANLIAAPFNGMLSEAIEKHLTQANSIPDVSWLEGIRQIAPALVNEVRKTAYFLLRAIPLLLLFIIPGINIIAPLLWFIFSAWLLAMEYTDFPMANHGILFDELRTKLRQKRFLVISFGAAVMLLMLVPVFNFFVMPVAVAGATVMYVEEWKQPD